MPPKRALKAPPAPARSPAKKAPRPAATKKKQAPPKPDSKKTDQTKVQKPKPKYVTQQLTKLLQDPSASARSIVDFVVGPTCGLESLHKWNYINSVTPFLLAVYFNRLDVAQLLVAEHSADTKAVHVPTNHTALHIACWSGHLEMVRWLVERCGLDVEDVDIDQRTYLHWATINMYNAVALLLLELGANPNHRDHSKRTPLHHACLHGLMDVVRALAAKGANIDAVDSVGRSPLSFAIICGHSDVALLLLELGADPNFPDARKSTPLHHACDYGLVDVVRVLLAEGASRDAVDSEGTTPFDIALHHSELTTVFGAVAAVFGARQ